METRGGHHVSGAQDAHHLKHVIIFGAEDRHPAQLFGNAAAGASVKRLGSGESHEHTMPLPTSINCLGDGRQVALKRGFHVSSVVMKIDGAVMTVFVCAT